MRPRGSAAELERRRERAVELLSEDRSLSEVARMVGAAPSAVWQWRETVRRNGRKGLKAKPVPGRPVKLDSKQRERLVQLLVKGAGAAGYATDLWTLPRVSELIKRKLGVEYHPAHVSRVLAECGWSCQKPERRAIERDEAAIEHWKRYKWVAVKKKRSA